MRGSELCRTSDGDVILRAFVRAPLPRREAAVTRPTAEAAMAAAGTAPAGGFGFGGAALLPAPARGDWYL